LTAYFNHYEPAEAKAKFSDEACVPLSKRKFWYFRLMSLIGLPVLDITESDIFASSPIKAWSK